MPNPFTISTTHQNNISIITLDGFVDAHTAPQFENAVQTELEAGNVRIVVDCSKLNYISSAGLGVFMSFIEEVRDLNGDIKISGLVPKVRHTFEILGFHDLFEMSEDLNSALASFSAAQSAKEG
ncbi:MAG: STAS domain-containing protein [Acidobacteria bacterium]|nr:STAS domain-containing protein [Acidobacteriota bacterium]